MGNELDAQPGDNTFLVPPSEASCDFASLPDQPDTFVVPVVSNVFYVTQRSRKH
jgi:hypothetical protein